MEAPSARERLSSSTFMGSSLRKKKKGPQEEDTFIHPEAMVEDGAVYVDVFR